MAPSPKCAHPSCECTVEPGGRFGKYCSDHCKQAGDKIEFEADRVNGAITVTKISKGH